MFSRMLYVRQHFPDRRLKDIPGEVQKQLSASGFGANLKPGARIAIGVGSRGISNIATIVRSVVDFWKSKGFQPFIFPAMGSHGAATAEGQADVLAHLGVHEATMGCPVISQLEVVSMGKTEDGLEAFLDKTAYDSDGIFLIGRVKWHTDFAGKLESGLFKMMAIGLGKFAGAQRYHTWAFNIGMEKVIRNVGRQMIKSGKILGGLAILEDGNHNTAQLTAIPVEGMEQREEELLVQVKSWMGRLPFDLDILMIDEVGKTYSGAGMDCKVVNRSVHGEYNPWDTAPKFVRVFLRGLSDHSYGNGVGVGMADIIHSRYLKKVDWTPTRINSLTSSTPPAVRIPIYYDSDRECLEIISKTVGKFDMSDIRIGWIGNSLEIGHMALSATLRSEIEKRPELEILGDEWELPYDSDGNLQNILLHEKLRELAGYEVSAAH
ncbi:MAG: hypothetical protein JST65_12505 [Acidobacteria bacterium]|nr:hypothetical protein [Acidobacteriota bacterium]